MAIEPGPGTESPDWDDEDVETRVPTSIGAIEVHLYDQDGDPANMGAKGSARVLDQDGTVLKIKRAANLRPYLTPAERAQLKTLMDRIRQEANDRILAGGQ